MRVPCVPSGHPPSHRTHVRLSGAGSLSWLSELPGSLYVPPQPYSPGDRTN